MLADDSDDERTSTGLLAAGKPNLRTRLEGVFKGKKEESIPIDTKGKSPHYNVNFYCIINMMLDLSLKDHPHPSEVVGSPASPQQAKRPSFTEMLSFNRVTKAPSAEKEASSDTVSTSKPAEETHSLPFSPTSYKRASLKDMLGMPGNTKKLDVSGGESIGSPTKPAAGTGFTKMLGLSGSSIGGKQSTVDDASKPVTSTGAVADLLDDSVEPDVASPILSQSTDLFSAEESPQPVSSGQVETAQPGVTPPTKPAKPTSTKRISSDDSSLQVTSTGDPMDGHQSPGNPTKDLESEVGSPPSTEEVIRTSSNEMLEVSDDVVSPQLSSIDDASTAVTSEGRVIDLSNNLMAESPEPEIQSQISLQTAETVGFSNQVIAEESSHAVPQSPASDSMVTTTSPEVHLKKTESELTSPSKPPKPPSFKKMQSITDIDGSRNPAPTIEFSQPVSSQVVNSYLLGDPVMAASPEPEVSSLARERSADLNPFSASDTHISTKESKKPAPQTMIAESSSNVTSPEVLSEKPEAEVGPTSKPAKRISIKKMLGLSSSSGKQAPLTESSKPVATEGMVGDLLDDYASPEVSSKDSQAGVTSPTSPSKPATRTSFTKMLGLSGSSIGGKQSTVDDASKPVTSTGAVADLLDDSTGVEEPPQKQEPTKRQEAETTSPPKPTLHTYFTSFFLKSSASKKEPLAALETDDTGDPVVSSEQDSTKIST